MGHKSICFHTRARNNDTRKITGGTFGGSFDLDTVNRLMRKFTVEITTSGQPTLVDSDGRQVRLYVAVDPAWTEKGQEALAVWREEQARLSEERRRIQEEQEGEIEDLLNSMTHEEAVRRLRGQED